MRRVLIPLLICLSWTASLSATSALTTITGTIVGPGGSNPSGTATLSWQRSQNDANPRQTIYPGNNTITITNGVIPNVQLFPNSAMLPAGTCYRVDYRLGNGQSTTRYWTVPVSATPVDVGLVEGNVPCSNQPGPIVAPGQISSAGAQPGQVLSWNGSYWAPATGGGGGGSPGGTNRQIQYNNLGVFGGFTVSGDCVVSIPNWICTKTNGVSFAPSATTDTTNASNITSGMLAPAIGGTGSGAFTQGSIPYVGAAGVYQQSNSSLFFDPVLFTLKVSGGSAGGYLALDNSSGGQQSAVSFRDAGVEKFQLGKQGGNSFYLFDDANSRDVLRAVFGNVFLEPVAGNVIVGAGTDGGYRFDVQSGNNTARVFNQTAGGSTLLLVQAGPTQSTSPVLQVSSNSGTALSQIGPDGCLNELNGALARSAVVCQNLFGLSSVAVLAFRSATSWDSGTADSGISRISAGLLGVGNGTQGDFSGSLKLANIALTGSGFTGGGVVSLCVDNSGNVTTSGCPGGGGGGTVTHTSGPLTAGRLVLGNGSNDIIVLGSTGTATTVYHGNAGGAGSFSAVSLTADVTGILPFANGGTGLNTNFTNHFFFGNSTGGTAAPVAVQPTFADLAAGTVGAAATFPGGTLFCGGVNTQTGTSYTMNATDECKLTTFNNASAIAVTLPQATTAGFTNGAEFIVSNIGAGTVTITPTTSTINGSSTLVLTAGQGALIKSNGTNYAAFVSASPTGSGTITSITFSGPLTGGTITSSGTVGCATCVTSAASLTSNQLVIGGGSQASVALGSLGTTTTLLHGNAGGAPAFSAVSLTADVTGVLPTANIAVALANQTSINGLGITASTGTLTIASGKTFTASNTITETATDGSTVAFGGGGTVGYVTGTMTSTAIVTSNGGAAIKTPSATTTLDTSGNISTPGTLSTGVGSGNAGGIDMGQGTSVAVPSNSFGFGAPATMTTSVRLESPNAVPSANNVMLFGAPSSNKATWAWTGISGTGSFCMTTSCVMTTPNLGTPSAITLTNATSLPASALPSQYKTLSCQPGLGDGLNAISSGTYLESTCWNKTGATFTITGIQCFTDNAGSSTMNAANGAGTGLLTGAVTCSSTIASGTQSGTTTIANNDFIKFTFVADGSSKQTTWVIAGTY